MTKITIAFILALLITAAASNAISSAKANAVPYNITYLPRIIINSDGSLTNGTNIITRTGNTYTLTADVNGYAIEIDRSNTIFDGAGHIINTTAGDDPGISLHDANGVTVKNLEVIGRYTNIYLSDSSNCLITNVETNMRIYLNDGSNYNTLTESAPRILNVGGSNNLIAKNNVSHELAVSGSNNILYQNNFFLEDLPGMWSDNSWDNGSIGNYWANYSTRYPDATEIGNTGIGDTPYVIERDPYLTKNYPHAKNTDYFPLMHPWGAPPEVVLLGEPNATYSGSYFLSFTMSKPASWIGYSLDGGENVTVTGNTTLTGLPSGLHNVTVYAKDAFGNEAASKTITFNVDLPPQPPDPLPVLPIAAATVVVAVIIVAAGLLLYNRKRRKEAQHT